MHGIIGMKTKVRKRKLIVVREPSGRPQRSADIKEFPPTQVKRLRDAALAGMADAEWGSVCGQMFLQGRLTPSMYAAAKRWSERVVRFHSAINAPQPNPKGLNLDRSGGTPPDPDSPDGQMIAKIEAAVVTDFKAAHAMLLGAGKLSEACVRASCERNDAPVGIIEVEALQRGLRWLSDYWNLTREAKS